MDRPRVVVCNVASLDGRLTIAPEVQLLHGDARWDAIADGCDPYAWMRALHGPEVFMEGSGSFVPDSAPPIPHPPPPGDTAALPEHHLPAHLVEVPGRRWMTVVDGRGRVELAFTEWPEPEWAGWHVLVITSRACSPGHLAWMREVGIPYLVAGDGPVDLPLAVALLQKELGVRTVVATGGGRFGGALLRAGLVDEVDVELLPAVIGGRGTPALFDARPLQSSEQPVPLQLLGCRVTDEGHVRLRYAVRPAPAAEP